jgi:8-oxo-dGTP diphosphatase
MFSIRLGVLCYLKKNGKTLMLYRNKKINDVHQNKWNGLGGKIEIGESPEDALKREVWEESNLKILKARLKGLITFPYFKDDCHWYVYVFESDSFVGEIQESNEGELHWINDHEIEKLNLWEGDHLFLNWMKGEKIFSAKIFYKGDRYIKHEVFFY